MYFFKLVYRYLWMPFRHADCMDVFCMAHIGSVVFLHICLSFHSRLYWSDHALWMLIFLFALIKGRISWVCLGRQKIYNGSHTHAYACMPTHTNTHTHTPCAFCVSCPAPSHCQQPVTQLGSRAKDTVFQVQQLGFFKSAFDFLKNLLPTTGGCYKDPKK